MKVSQDCICRFLNTKSLLGNYLVLEMVIYEISLGFSDPVNIIVHSKSEKCFGWPKRRMIRHYLSLPRAHAWLTDRDTFSKTFTIGIRLVRLCAAVNHTRQQCFCFIRHTSYITPKISHFHYGKIIIIGWKYPKSSYVDF